MNPSYLLFQTDVLNAYDTKISRACTVVQVCSSMALVLQRVPADIRSSEACLINICKQL